MVSRCDKKTGSVSAYARLRAYHMQRTIGASHDHCTLMPVLRAVGNPWVLPECPDYLAILIIAPRTE
jgi:hypothetical protein